MSTSTHGDRQRQRILETAADLGSAEGLAGLSISQLATATGLSKSGLFAHFGSKQGLQIAAIEAASARFDLEVVQATEECEHGLERLRALVTAWIGHVEHGSLRGGCFFFATSAEFGSRPGPVRDLLAERTGGWLRLLEREARAAVRQRELRSGCDPADLAFRLHAFVQEANWARELLDQRDAFARARRAVEDALRAEAPEVEATEAPASDRT